MREAVGEALRARAESNVRCGPLDYQYETFKKVTSALASTPTGVWSFVRAPAKSKPETTQS